MFFDGPVRHVVLDGKNPHLYIFSMALTPVDKLKCAFELAKLGSQVNPGILVTRIDRQKRIQEKFRKLFMEGPSTIVLDTDRNSLQWRILNYLKKKHWIDRPADLLNASLASAKVASENQFRQAFLGGSGKANALDKSRSKFEEYEQWLCYQAAIKGQIPPPFTIDDFTALVGRAYQKGVGKDLIGFLCGLHFNHKRRIKELKKRDAEVWAEGQAEPEDFHPGILIMSLMWVFPPMPFWLFPSRAIADVIREVSEDIAAQKPETIDRAIKDAGLVRIPKGVSGKFFSVSADKKGKALLAEIEAQTKFDISTCFGGRRRDK